MFDSLQERLGEVFGKLTRRGALSEADVGAALREVRVALLEADVALPVVKDFVEAVREKAVGQDVLRSVTPGQMVVKIVHDHLVETLGGSGEGLNLNVTPPAVIMLVGLQGSGKTTSTAKIALRLKELCEQYGIRDRMPRPIIPGDKRTLNKRVVEALANQLYHMELSGEPSRRVWAYRKAAWAIEDTPQGLGLIYRTMGRKGLESIENVGPKMAGVIEDLIQERV